MECGAIAVEFAVGVTPSAAAPLSGFERALFAGNRVRSRSTHGNTAARHIFQVRSPERKARNTPAAFAGGTVRSPLMPAAIAVRVPGAPTGSAGSSRAADESAPAGPAGGRA
jgi:hypothetical protein